MILAMLLRASARVIAIGVLGPLVLIAPMFARATPEPDHTVVRRLGDIEVRQYADYAVAEVVVPGPADAAGNQAFPLLFGYISGKNRGERKLEMTVPVTQSVALGAPGAVTQSAAGAGFVVQFVLPKGVTRDTAPVPADSRVTVRDVPGRRVAAVRFSGVWSAQEAQQQLARLQDTLRSAGIAWSGEPMQARYNSPFTPGFLRRNELWLDVP